LTGRVLIRAIDEGERADWEPLWIAYLDFYNAKLPQATRDITWRRFHDPAEPIFALGAYIDGRMVGIAHSMFHRSAWTPGDYCYLQDLYVDENVRGAGVGRALIEGVCERAKAAGASRVHWLTQPGNSRARILYDKVAEDSGFMQYRVIF